MVTVLHLPGPARRRSPRRTATASLHSRSGLFDDATFARHARTTHSVALSLRTSQAKTSRSTFSIDVDTASYANVRSYLTRGALPPAHHEVSSRRGAASPCHRPPPPAI